MSQDAGTGQSGEPDAGVTSTLRALADTSGSRDARPEASAERVAPVAAVLTVLYALQSVYAAITAGSATAALMGVLALVATGGLVYWMVRRTDPRLVRPLGSTIWDRAERAGVTWGLAVGRGTAVALAAVLFVSVAGLVLVLLVYLLHSPIAGLLMGGVWLVIMAVLVAKGVARRGDAVARIVARTGSVSATGPESAAVRRAAEGLALAAGMAAPPDVYRYQSDGLNAWVAGSFEAGAIGVSSAMVGALTAPEIEAVVATLIARLKSGVAASPERASSLYAIGVRGWGNYTDVLSVYQACDHSALMLMRRADTLMSALDKTAQFTCTSVPGLDIGSAVCTWTWPGAIPGRMPAAERARIGIVLPAMAFLATYAETAGTLGERPEYARMVALRDAWSVMQAAPAPVPVPPGA